MATRVPRNALISLIINVGQDMWIYFLGPFLSLLPTRWRKALPLYQAVHWRSAAILSGLAESSSALVALMYWYWYSMSTSLSHLGDLVLDGKTAPGRGRLTDT